MTQQQTMRILSFGAKRCQDGQPCEEKKNCKELAGKSGPWAYVLHLHGGRHVGHPFHMCATRGHFTWENFWAIRDDVRQGQDRLQPREAPSRKTLPKAYLRYQLDSMQYASRKVEGVKGGYPINSPRCVGILLQHQFPCLLQPGDFLKGRDG